MRDHALEPVPAVVSTWGRWRLSHPNTTVVAADGGVDRVYVPAANPRVVADTARLPRGRVDPRMEADAMVLGVVGPAGPVAFPVTAVERVLGEGAGVTSHGVVVVRVAGGLSAGTEAGPDATGPPSFVEATWSAWSHRHPDTALWDP